MPRALTPAQAARILARFDKDKSLATEKGFNRGLNYAKRLSVTKYMQGLGSGEQAQRPNPAPGPIGIRKGKLRRSVRVIPAQREKGGWTGGLGAGGKDAPYARIQEEGGKTRAHVIRPRIKQVLRWKGDIVSGPGGMGPGFTMSRGPTRISADGTRKVGARKKSSRYDVFALQVNHPGSDIPARPYLTPAMEEAVPVIVREVERENEALIRRLFGE